MTSSWEQNFGRKIILPAHNLQTEKGCGFVLFYFISCCIFHPLVCHYKLVLLWETDFLVMWFQAYFKKGWFLPLCSSQVTLSPKPQTHKVAESELLKSHQPCPAPEFALRTPELSQTAAPVWGRPVSQPKLLPKGRAALQQWAGEIVCHNPLLLGLGQNHWGFTLVYGLRKMLILS